MFLSLSLKGCTQKTNNELDDRTIPIGWYDTGDGLYNPENHVIHKYDTGKFLRHAGNPHKYKCRGK